VLKIVFQGWGFSSGASQRLVSQFHSFDDSIERVLILVTRTWTSTPWVWHFKPENLPTLGQTSLMWHGFAQCDVHSLKHNRWILQMYWSDLPSYCCLQVATFVIILLTHNLHLAFATAYIWFCFYMLEGLCLMFVRFDTMCDMMIQYFGR
jgi:hypothetical protein